MRLLISYIFLLVTVNVFTQQWTDVGVNLGLSFYNGDLNESKLYRICKSRQLRPSEIIKFLIAILSLLILLIHLPSWLSGIAADS